MIFPNENLKKNSFGETISRKNGSWNDFFVQLGQLLYQVAYRRKKKSRAKFPKEKWNWDHMFLEDLDFTYMGKNPKKLQGLRILKSYTTNECGISFF